MARGACGTGPPCHRGACSCAPAHPCCALRPRTFWPARSTPGPPPPPLPKPPPPPPPPPWAPRPPCGRRVLVAGDGGGGGRQTRGGAGVFHPGEDGWRVGRARE